MHQHIVENLYLLIAQRVSAVNEQVRDAAQNIRSSARIVTVERILQFRDEWRCDRALFCEPDTNLTRRLCNYQMYKVLRN